MLAMGPGNEIMSSRVTLIGSEWQGQGFVNLDNRDWQHLSQGGMYIYESSPKNNFKMATKKCFGKGLNGRLSKIAADCMQFGAPQSSWVASFKRNRRYKENWS